MSYRQRKREKNILREFSHLSEADLMVEIHDAVEKFVILIKSEEQAARILKKYDKKAYFDFNENDKHQYYKLMVCARLRNLSIPSEWYDVDITDDDVIERIKEVMYDDIKWIDENSYLYDSCHVDDINDFNDTGYGDWPSDIEIDKVRDFYLSIIEETFGNKKKLVK